MSVRLASCTGESQDVLLWPLGKQLLLFLFKCNDFVKVNVCFVKVELGIADFTDLHTVVHT